METKKNSNVDLNRNSGLYFVIGLALVLFLTWRLLEYKTFESEMNVVQLLDVEEDLKEDVPIMQTINMPPLPPSAPEIIEVVEDEAEVEETVIESTEMNQETVVDDSRNAKG